MKEVVTDALGKEAKKFEVFGQALGYAKWLVSTFRTEERRKVITELIDYSLKIEYDVCSYWARLKLMLTTKN